MWRAVAVFLGFLAVAWFEFDIFPGHTYLASDQPALRSGDRASDHAGISFARSRGNTSPSCIAPSTTRRLFSLRSAARLDFRTALVAQQIVCRVAALLGVFLMGRAVGLKPLIGIAYYCPGEPRHLFYRGRPFTSSIQSRCPASFATGLTLLAVGWLVFEKPLLAAFSGGLALLYDPVMAAPFWLIALTAFAFDKQMRKTW